MNQSIQTTTTTKSWIMIKHPWILDELLLLSASLAIISKNGMLDFVQGVILGSTKYFLYTYCTYMT
jgi:hypothetical protein